MALKKTSSRSKSSGSESKWPYLLFGVLFGYFLSKARATDYDSIVDMFRCKEFQLYGVIGTAILVTSLGLFLMKRSSKPTFSGKPFEGEPLKWEPQRLMGAFLFGAGWALAGTCPGTSLAQLGEGKLVAVFTVVGIAAGVWAYKRFMPGTSSKDQVC